MRLTAHPAHPPLGVASVDAAVVALGLRWLTLRWRIEGAERLIVPPFAGKGRADGLWRTTCFELFVAHNGDGGGNGGGQGGYIEFNLSPSERWATYEFAGYREGMAGRAAPRDAVCTLRRGGRLAFFDAAIPIAALPPLPWRFGLAAVIEEEGRAKSYWALAHAGEAPDFHDPACFTETLAAPERG